MNSEFEIPPIDLDKLKIVSDEPSRKVLSLYNHLDIHRNEMQQWFKMLEHAEVMNRSLLLKPITIEIDELVSGCRRLNNWIRKDVNQINALYRSAGRNNVLTPTRKGLRKELNKPLFKKEIKEARNKIAAHRYTSKAGDFITIGEAIKNWNSIAECKLKEAFETLNKCLDEMEQWISANRNHLAFLED